MNERRVALQESLFGRAGEVRVVTRDLYTHEGGEQDEGEESEAEEHEEDDDHTEVGDHQEEEIDLGSLQVFPR